jgi:hypothetical protein
MTGTGGYAKGHPGKDLYFRASEYTNYLAHFECKSTFCESEYPLFTDDLAEDRSPRVQLSILWFKGIGEGKEKFRKLLFAFGENVHCDRLWLDMPEIDDACLMWVCDMMERKKSQRVEYNLVSIKWASDQFRILIERTLSIYASTTSEVSRVHIEIDNDISKEDIEFFIGKTFKYTGRLCVELSPRFMSPGGGVSGCQWFKRPIYDILIDAFYERPCSVLFITDWPRTFGCQIGGCTHGNSNSDCQCFQCTNGCVFLDCIRCKVNRLRKRNLDMRWCHVHPLVLNVTIALVALQLPPYVLLEIIDWLPPASLCDKFGNDWNRFRKMQMISSVYQFHLNKPHEK